jgi:hypothetical protein
MRPAAARPVREIPRVWEVDWAVPAAEGGTAWAAYDWAFDTAEQLGVNEITIVGATYDNLGNLGLAIGPVEADSLRRLSHEYQVDGIRVRGVPMRGGGFVRGVVLVAWANDEILARLEGQRPRAIAAVASWPDYIPAWLATFRPERIGQVRPDAESEFAAPTVVRLDVRAAESLDRAAASVNEHHAGLHGSEREVVAGALVALRDAGVPVDTDALRAHLMQRGWDGGMVADTVKLAERVASGTTPRHKVMRLN